MPTPRQARSALHALDEAQSALEAQREATKAAQAEAEEHQRQLARTKEQLQQTEEDAKRLAAEAAREERERVEAQAKAKGEAERLAAEACDWSPVHSSLIETAATHRLKRLCCGGRQLAFSRDACLAVWSWFSGCRLPPPPRAHSTAGALIFCS